MTNEQILKKAIEKAVENGMPSSGGYKKMIEDGTIDMLVAMGAYYNTIFSHSFAKAFVRYVFKKHKYNYDDLMYYYEFPADIKKAKKVFLQQMVLEKEPLKYLEKFLEEK